MEIERPRGAEFPKRDGGRVSARADESSRMRRPKVVVCDREESIIEERFKTGGCGSLWAGADRAGGGKSLRTRV